MKRPNVLYIMADDHAANAISCYGSRFASIAPTPNIDRIAREGMRLDDCFCTNAICSPSRAVILTGQHSHVNGVRTLSDGLDPRRPTAATRLQAAGYQTAVFGKWHLHSQPQGFDCYRVLHDQGEYHNPSFKESGRPWEQGHKGAEQYIGYVTGLITDFSLDWLKSRDKDRPFFLLCHHKAPHDNWEYHPKHARLFAGVEMPEPASLWEDKSHRSEGSRSYGSTIHDLGAERMQSKNYPIKDLDITGMDWDQVKRATYQKYLKDYLRCVASIDDNVGRLLDYLDEEGLTENTLVIYTSDQGQFLGEHDYWDKRWIYEESLRMPFLARWPAEIRAGSVNSDICLNLDFAPTFLDCARLAIPPDMQGRSLRPVFAGATPSDWRQSMYYHYWMHMAHQGIPGHYGVRTKRHKLIFFYGLPLDASGAKPDPTPPGMELYDLQADPLELHNVYDDPAYAGVREELKAELLRLKEQVGDTDDRYPALMERRQRFFPHGAATP